MKNEEIDRAVGFLKKSEQHLFMNLLWENEGSAAHIDGNKAFITGESDSYMISERLEAWARLLQFDLQASALFISSSRSALDYVIDKAPECELVSHFDAIPVYKQNVEKLERWADKLMGYLEMLASNDWPTSIEGIDKVSVEQTCNKTVSLKIYIIPGATPHELFARCVDRNVSKIRTKKRKTLYKNTLLGYIQC